MDTIVIDVDGSKEEKVEIITEEMLSIERELENETLKEEEEYLKEARAKMEMKKDSMKLNQLDDLLAKAGLYSEFLSQNANLDALATNASSKEGKKHKLSND